MRYLFALSLLLTLVPAPYRAQSGRHQQTSPSTTTVPGAGRPRRAVNNNPPADNQPGQPATPDAPGMIITPQATPQSTPPQAASPSPAPEQSAPRSTPAAVAPDAAKSGVHDDAKDADGAEITDDDEIVKVSSNLVPVSATVTDVRGKAITDLTVDDFELRVDGQPKPIGDLSHAETPVRMVMLFDNSISQRTAREFEKRAAMQFFRRVLRPIDQSAVFSFATEINLEQPFTNDVNKLVRSIEGFGEPEGATKLLEAIVKAADYLKFQPGRKVIVLVSDGQDSYSNPKLTFDETLRNVIAADCQLYAVQTGIDENLNILPLEAIRRLEILSDRTGGSVSIPKNTAELDTAFAQIAADLAQQYVLSYYPTDEGRDGRYRTISLRVKTRPNLRVRSRRGYYPRGGKGQPLTSSVSGNVPRDDEHAVQSSEPFVNLNATRDNNGSTGNAKVPSALDRPQYGNKNMDQETSGDAPARAETNARPKPTPPQITEMKSAPSGDASPKDKSQAIVAAAPETKPAPASSPDATPAARSTPPRATTPATAEPGDHTPPPLDAPVSNSETPSRAQSSQPFAQLSLQSPPAAQQERFAPVVQVAGQFVQASGFITYNFVR